MKSHGRILVVFFVLTAALLTLGVGCSDDDDGDTPEVPGGGGAESTELTIEAENNEFDKDELSAPANTEVTLELVNNDDGVLHNLSVYQSSDAREVIFTGELFTGVDTRTYTFETPAAGEYFFRCDVHPDTMTGTFVSS